jgi:two-component system cell cycle response regulator
VISPVAVRRISTISAYPRTLNRPDSGPALGGEGETSSLAIQQSDLADQALSECWRLACTGRSLDALSQALAVWEQAKAKRDIRLEARASIDIAWYCFQVGQPEQGRQHARKAAQLGAGLCEVAWEAKARSLHAWLLTELGCPEEAVEEAIRALGLAENAGDQTVLCWALNVVGIVFWVCRQPERAIEFCERAVAHARKIGDPVLLCWWLVNLGGTWCELAYTAREQGDTAGFDAAMKPVLSFTEEARALAESTADPWALRLCLGNLAEYSTAIGDFAASKSYLDAYAKVVGGDYQRGEEHYRYTLGQTLIHLGQPDEAIEHLMRAIEIAEQTRNIDAIVHAADYLSDAFERKGDFRQALDFHRRYHAAYVKMSAENAQRRARLAEVRYESDKLRDLADKDPLTGLFNRRRFEAALAEFQAAGHIYAVAMIDIDHFKKINDGFSHMVGDQVLREIGGLILSTVRGEDLAVRYGGEEFALLLKSASPVLGHDVCNRLRETIAAWGWDGIATGLSVTASIGLASSTEVPQPDKLLQLADQRLYAAKAAGRNRVISTGEERVACPNP